MNVALGLLALTCVATVLALVPGGDSMGYDRFALPKELVATAGVLAAAICWLLSRRPPVLDALALALAGTVLLAAVSATGAGNPWLAWRGFATVLVTAAAFLVARGLAATGRRGALLLAVLAAASLLAATVIAEAHGLLPSWSLDGRAPGGTEGNRNFMGHALAVMLPLAVALTAMSASTSRRVAALAATALLAAAITLSRSRGAWLAAGAGTLVTAILTARTHRRALALTLLAMATAVAAAIIVPNQLRWRTPSPYADTLHRLVEHDRGSGRGRTLQYDATARMTADHPWLGVGPGNWSVAYPAYAPPGDPSHEPSNVQPVNRLPNSDWLGIAAERGLPSLALLVAIGALLLHGAWRRRRATDLSPVALTGVLTALAVGGAFDAVLLRPTPALLAAVALGALAPVGRPLVALPAAAWRRLAFPAAAATATIALLLTLSAFRTLQSARLAARGTPGALATAAALTPGDYRVAVRLALLANHRGDCAAAARWARAGLAAYPHHRIAARILAGCASADPHAAEPDPVALVR